MRFTRASVGLGVSSLLALGCGSDKVVGPASQITLSAAQATVLMNKIGQFAPLHNQIAWLADSANLVIKSGSQVDLIPVSTNLAPGPFYAVGLQRAVQLTGSSFSTFNLIAFDDPSASTQERARRRRRPRATSMARSMAISSTSMDRRSLPGTRLSERRLSPVALRVGRAPDFSRALELRARSLISQCRSR